MKIIGNKLEISDFRDIVISALRYALPRHTYILPSTCEFIYDNADIIIDNRVKDVMLRDIDEQLKYYEDNKAEFGVIQSLIEDDEKEIKKLKEFLENYENNTRETD